MAESETFYELQRRSGFFAELVRAQFASAAE
jgi:hypothetical protein